MNELQMNMARDTSGIVSAQIMQEPSGMEGRVIKSRFGEVTVTLESPVSFPNGLLGFADMTRYCLLQFPVKKFQRFRLLQSLEDEALSFIVMPLVLPNPILDDQDVKLAASEIGIAEQDLSIMMIVSVHRLDQLVRLSVNARAPIFMDMIEQKAVQHVFSNSKYRIQHFISGETTDKV